MIDRGGQQAVQMKDLDTDVRYVKGVGPKRAGLLASYGIRTVSDLINFFPRRYLFYGRLKSIKELKDGEDAIILAKVRAVEYIGFTNRKRIKVHLEDENKDRAVAQWFYAGYLRSRFSPGQTVKIWGRVKYIGKIPYFTNPGLRLIDAKDTNLNEDLFDKTYTQPIYPEIKGIKPSFIKRIVNNALAEFGKCIKEWLPEYILKERNLLDLKEAYKLIHQPENPEQWSIARKRLAYDELLVMQLGLEYSNTASRGFLKTPVMRFSREIHLRIIRRFPFTLTADQRKAISDIVKDMTSARPMYRLLQGDVGAGKTIVAIYAALLAVANRWQVAIMVPTEVLAFQHYKKITSYLKGSRVRVGLLVGSLSKKDKEDMLKKLAEGKIDIVVGTHSLIQEGVNFARLGLVVIDEQHKFGVAQRIRLRSKGIRPHMLVMTATPIPRTLALSFFGKLNCSVIKTPPPGRRPVITRLVGPDELEGVWEFIRNKLKEGHQGFIVYPVLSESDKHELKSAEGQYEYLKNRLFPEFNIALIHGRVPYDKKIELVKDFAAGKIKLLVATVVVEVGIDLPEATILVVEHAERFGLAQLHQLRGRVARSRLQGYCFLVAEPRSEIAKKRLEVMVKTTDGFKIAEADLKLRGPGEFFGTAQHGLPEFKVADLLEDYDLLLAASEDARRILADDPRLKRPENRAVREMLFRELSHRIELVDAG